MSIKRLRESFVRWILAELGPLTEASLNTREKPTKQALFGDFFFTGTQINRHANASCASHARLVRVSLTMLAWHMTLLATRIV